MKAVNLIPGDSRRGVSGVRVGISHAHTYVILGALALALALVTVYVLTSNSISASKARIAALNVEVDQARAETSRLGNYSQFAQLAQTRALTVRELAAARFDWHAALSDLSRVVPPNTSLQSLTGTVAPGASAGASAGAGVSGDSLRGDITAPAFELTGCTATQDDVARLMSRLRLINGVTRVSLSDSAKAGSGTAGAGAPASSGSSAGTASQSCGANGPAFDLVVFFQPIAGVGPNGATSLGGTTAGGAGATTAGAGSTTAGAAK